VRQPRNSAPRFVASRGTRLADRGYRLDGLWFEEQLMTSFTYRSSRPDGWIQPRPHQDPTLRYMKHGRILPMEEPGFLARLFGRY
jgi:hypothetical protein